jgi:flagellin-like hook-associated protein FlgL
MDQAAKRFNEKIEAVGKEALQFRADMQDAKEAALAAQNELARIQMCQSKDREMLQKEVEYLKEQLGKVEL